MRPALALIDVSTILYQVYFRNCKSYKSGVHKESTTINWLYGAILSLTKPGIAPGYTPVYLFDQKRQGSYWRQEFMDQHKELYSKLWADYSEKKRDESYKGGRLTPEEYNPLLDLTRKAAELIKKDHLWFSVPGLEADDFAGLFTKYKEPDIFLDFVTVDRDWAALTDDEKNVRWINMYTKKRYTIETQKEVLEYFRKKLSKKIMHPLDAFEFKRLKGELGDNLPPGCHIELIDLLNHCAPLDYGFESAHTAVKEFYNNLYTI